MKTNEAKSIHLRGRGTRGMTLFEVLLAIAISAMAIAGIVYGYVYSSGSAEKAALSLAANAQTSERLEQVRSAVWNVSSSPAIDQLVVSNFPSQTVRLDLSGSGTGVTYATNYTQITTISTNPPLKRIRVDCVWMFQTGQLMTNTIETCRSPDQ
jgi:prepilin-type N-terminal cleavage/methylation domain-containing protein